MIRTRNRAGPQIKYSGSNPAASCSCSFIEVIASSSIHYYRRTTARIIVELQSAKMRSVLLGRKGIGRRDWISIQQSLANSKGDDRRICLDALNRSFRRLDGHSLIGRHLMVGIRSPHARTPCGRVVNGKKVPASQAESEEPTHCRGCDSGQRQIAHPSEVGCLYALCSCPLARYGQLPRTVKCGPSSIAGEPFCDLGTITLAVAVPTLPEASVAVKVIV